jgi:hypothetical protein
MTATFLYSDAPHPVNFLSPAAREGVLNVIFAKKSPRRAMFHLVEAELLAHLGKEHANFATTTSFKVCAFLLGHSSYAPSTRIKTLNAGGAAVGAGGALVPVTQNVPGGGGVFGEGSLGSAAATGLMGAGGGGLTQNAAGHANFFDPESSIGTGGGLGAGAPSRLQLNVDIKAAGAGGPSRLKGAAGAAEGSGAQNPSPKAGASSPSPLYKSMVTNKAAAAAAAASAALSPSNAGSSGDAAQCMSPSANGASANNAEKDGAEGDAVPLAADLQDSSAPVAAAAATPAVLVVADESDAAIAVSPANAASPKADSDEEAEEDEQQLLSNKQQQQEDDA